MSKASIYISGVIGKETTLKDVIRQFKSFENITEIEARINSEGGDVDEGEAIYNYLNGLKSDYLVNTYASKAYSISAKIFSVGENRIVEDVDNAIMIHFAWAKAEGKAEKFEIIAEYLRGLEDEFASYYSGFLDIDEASARALLDKDTFISGSEAVELGFATEIQTAQKAVALFKDESINLKSSKMSTKKKSNLLTAFAAWLDGVDAEVVALVLQDSNSTEIEFPDLETGDVPKVGDKANIDGSPVPDGSYIMPSLDNATVTFEGGAITEIIEAADPAEEEVEVNAKGKKPVEAKAEEIKEIMNWTVQVVNTTFAIGDVVEYDYEGESYPVSAGEFEIPDGRRIVTDASGTIIAIKEAVVSDPAVEETAADVQASLAEVIEKMDAKISAKYEKKNAEIVAELKAVKKLLGSKEIEINAEGSAAGDSKKKSLLDVMRNGRTKK